MDLILITSDPTRASIAELAGVDTIMVDLEINGKVARQGHLNTLISRHSMEDVERLRSVVCKSRLLVRVNPLYPGSGSEIERLVAIGVDAIMLPMFTHPSEASDFVRLVHGRCDTWLLLETPQAIVRCDEILEVSGIDAIHIGLNDLHLGLGLDFMFEPLGGGLVDWLCQKFSDRGVRFGIGGVARLQSGLLPAELVLSEHVRLGSSQVILSRDFQGILEQEAATALDSLTSEINKIRAELQRLRHCSAEELLANRQALRLGIRRIVAAKRAAPRA